MFNRLDDYSNVEFDWKIDPASYLTMDADVFGNYNILLNGHAHTTYSDAYGFNAVIVSDHNTLEGGLEAQRIAREKYNDSIIVMSDTHAIHWSYELKEMIDKVHELGGLVTVNHIPWSNSTEWKNHVGTLPNHPTREELHEMGVDGFEIINGNIFDYETYKYARDKVLLMITGTDVHHPSSVAHSWTVLNSQNMTVQGIMKELREKRTTFFFDATGPRQVYYPNENPTYYKLLPLFAITDIWNSFYDDYRGMYSFQGTFCHQRKVVIHWRSYWWFVLWCLIFFGFYELGRWGINKLWRYGIIKFNELKNRKRGNRRRRNNSVSSEEEINRQNDLIDLEI
ncbi:285_t:CDS:2 [Diversispora eburnea]|uniref:285_t:CDS:1 n=1 Tax=Diversispora eburnea TaxID=1213867 RepID=A0A9N8VQB4_9GLOM|nr:285_t:CDS:2 [Diversispora eburnea]